MFFLLELDKSSHTTAELRSILGRSWLRGWHIVEDSTDVMVVKEA